MRRIRAARAFLVGLFVLIVGAAVGGFLVSNRSAGGGVRWVPGDVHVHTEANPDTSLTREQIIEALGKQKLEVAAVLIWGVRFNRTASFFTGEDWSGLPIITHVDLETSSFTGGYPDHVIALGLKDWHFQSWLFSYQIFQWGLEQNAVVGVAHADHWLDSPTEFPKRTTQVPLDFPCCVALGQPLFLSTQEVNHAGFRRLWYGLLDCGFRVPLTAGSDWPVAGRFPGEVRTYVALEGELTYRKWIEGIRAGRTSIAQGALDRLELRANGQLPGSEIRLPAGGGTVELALDVTASEDDALEVVVNGEVKETRKLSAGHARLMIPVRLERSAWLAARTRRTHAGAVYALVGERPIRANAAAARYFVAQLEDLEQQIQLMSFAGTTWAQNQIKSEREAAHDLIARARATFERIATEAESAR